VAPGICIRLYEEDDLLARPAFTDPEILRTNLASVILQMTALGSATCSRSPSSSRRTGATSRTASTCSSSSARSTPRRTTRASGSPRSAGPSRSCRSTRGWPACVEADRNGCVRDVLVIAAALSIQDPRERPQDKQQAANEAHKRFVDETSDFLTYLNLWRYLQEQQQELGSSAFRGSCKKEFLNHLRVREWQDLHSQLRRALSQLDLSLEHTPTNADAIHLSLLAGLLSHVGLRDAEKREYVGARNARFALVPSSSLAKKAPRWVMAAELVETNRMWGRVAARIDPAWVEKLAEHLVKRQYSEPHWERKQAAVMAYERVTLYGIPVVAQRKVAFGRIAPVLSREMFLRSALVEGDWDTSHAFFAANRALLDDVEELENRARRRDLVGRRRGAVRLLRQAHPGRRVSGRHFDAWWKTAKQATPELLTFTMADLVSDDSAVLSAMDHPDVWVQGDLHLPLTYQFEPGSDADGVTVHVPVAVLNRLTPEGFDWQVPGLRQDLVTALIRSLPKPLRVRCVPAPDTAAHVLAVVEPRTRPLLDALETELLNLKRVDIRAEDWDWSKVPDHLRMTFRVEDERGRTLAEGKDLEALQAQLGRRCSRRSRLPRASSVPASPPGMSGRCRSRCSRGPSTASRPSSTRGPASPCGCSARPGSRRWPTGSGVRRLIQLSVPNPVKAVSGRLTNATKLALTRNPHGTVPGVLGDCATAALDALMAKHGGAVRDAAAFDRLREAVRTELVPGARRGAAAGHRGPQPLVRRAHAARRRDPVRAGGQRRGHARAPRPARATGLRHRHRARAPARPAALPAGAGRTADEARRGPCPRPDRHGAGRAGRGRDRRRGSEGQALAGARAGALDGGGAADQPVRPADAHALPGVGEARLQGARRAAALILGPRSVA
jgi:ATP-dependent helicase HrpA